MRRPAFRCAAALPALSLVGLLAGCGGGDGGVASTPAAPATTPAPAPTATPTPSPTTPPVTLIPAESFRTAEYARSDGPVYHSAIPAWQTGASGKGVTLGIIDTGIDTSNPELAGRIVAASRDVVSSRGLANTDSHGTQVALTAAAARDNSGIMGIAWEADILMARADAVGSCDTSGGCSFSDSAIAAGMDLAVANGAKVINISLGGAGADGRVLRAVANAAAAGVVVVVSAGNGAAANPNAFATSLRQAGAGNVIIAGSVNATGALSSFSNRAGTDASWYLAALGEQVCCVYENGRIKTTVDANGQTFITVLSGTSFAAPQIAGAAALLRQAFPTLTAQQVVDLLLSSATDAGTAGIDSTFGRGILNIASAFAPRGTTSLAGVGTTLLATDTSLVASAAMGDAGQGGAITTTVLDAYQRAYALNLSGMARRAPVAPRLGAALLGQGRAISLANGPVALAFTAGQPGQGGTPVLPWSGPLRLSRDDAGMARVLAGRIVARIAPGLEAAFGLAAGADGLAVGLRGAPQPAFLVATPAADDVGFVRSDLVATALRLGRGRTGLTVAAEGGRVLPSRVGAGQPGDPLREAPRVTRFGATLDRRFGALTGALAASWLSEDRTVLGARLAPGLGGRGADSLFLDLAASWRPGAGWSLSGAWRHGLTRARGGDILLGSSRFASSAWNVDLVRHGLLGRRDSLALRLAQPLRVESGGLDLRLPTAWDYATRSATSTVQRLTLTPTGRELDAELAWSGPLGAGTAGATLYWRRDPGHIRSLPAEQGAALRWSLGF
ncbi:S8 family serine peptidase [Novosphingobium piscinae]|uniref:S8 family serine peptidase n=1 Tax=Novosphingobium piscinae TaxID=1507448 RepID=A0A7X1G190_9SPHN|nr:S8 family peptidase [Novosphingobium piscinae]MBC2670763.1 S8 family serine peptidase [Novosphingobium piscinae]